MWGEEARLRGLGGEEPDQICRESAFVTVFESSRAGDRALLSTRGDDAVILMSGEGVVGLASADGDASPVSGDWPEALLPAGDEARCVGGVAYLISERAGEWIPAWAGGGAPSWLDEGVAPLPSGVTLPSLGSGVGVSEETRGGGVYLGAGVDSALPVLAERPLCLPSGVGVRAPPAGEVGEREPSGGGQSSESSGVEALLKRSGRETLPLSSGKGEEP